MNLRKQYPKEFGVWRSMIGRCENKNSQQYKWYGGKGVSVCPEWRHSFDTFITDMGGRPSDKHSIDRISSAGNYESSNCRWATVIEQMRNRPEFNVLIEYKGENLCLAEWSERLNIPFARIATRFRAGWSAERIFNEPLNYSPIPKKVFDKSLMQEYKSVSAASRIKGISQPHLKHLLDAGKGDNLIYSDYPCDFNLLQIFTPPSRKRDIRLQLDLKVRLLPSYGFEIKSFILQDTEYSYWIYKANDISIVLDKWARVWLIRNDTKNIQSPIIRTAIDSVFELKQMINRWAA